MSKPVQKYPLNAIVEVTWSDASTRGHWDLLEYYEEHGPASCISVGYLVRHTKNDILLVHTQSDDAQANGAIAIPSVWVKEVRVLSKPTKTKAKNAKRKRTNKTA